MKALIWIAVIVAVAGFAWLFVKAMKREMAKPDRPDGEWGNLNDSRADNGGGWGSGD